MSLDFESMKWFGVRERQRVYEMQLFRREYWVSWVQFGALLHSGYMSQVYTARDMSSNHTSPKTGLAPSLEGVSLGVCVSVFMFVSKGLSTVYHIIYFITKIKFRRLRTRILCLIVLFSVPNLYILILRPKVYQNHNWFLYLWEYYD